MKTLAVLIVAVCCLGSAVAFQGKFLDVSRRLNSTEARSGQCSVVGCSDKPAPSGCKCDRYCGCRGDCCWDYIPVCTGGQRGCSFEGCGGISCSGGGCSCEKDCNCKGNCCSDWVPVCTGGVTGCLFEGCGGYSCSGQCWCDKLCVKEGDCCSNYKATCT